MFEIFTVANYENTQFNFTIAVPSLILPTLSLSLDSCPE